MTGGLSGGTDILRGALVGSRKQIRSIYSGFGYYDGEIGGCIDYRELYRL